jgi:DNA-binding MarR family transcriptional regulator
MMTSYCQEEAIMQHTPSGANFTDLILETFRLNGALIAAGNRLVEDLGLTSARWQVLGGLTDGPATVPAIARKMGLTRQSVQRIADRLMEEGFVATAPNPGHRRAKLHALTSHGEAVMAEVSRRQIEWSNRIVGGIDSEELAAALSVLTKLRVRLEDDERV